tara:strand:+ start:588 stop:743 length:156 start_codon:yes stop_codon:yes gene_type:complete
VVTTAALVSADTAAVPAAAPATAAIPAAIPGAAIPPVSANFASVHSFQNDV